VKVVSNFTWKITYLNTLATELRAILYGLQHVQSMYLQHVLIECDYKVAGGMIQCGYTDISYLQPISVDIVYTLQTLNMHLDLHHIDHSTNKGVDLLAPWAYYTFSTQF